MRFDIDTVANCQFRHKRDLSSVPYVDIYQGYVRKHIRSNKLHQAIYANRFTAVTPLGSSQKDLLLSTNVPEIA